MLDRLLIALVNGPGLNCRPHSSRQRVDFQQLSRLQDITPEAGLCALLGEDRQVKFSARAAMPRRRARGNGSGNGEQAEEELTAEEKETQRKWQEQDAVLRKLRNIAEDARTYEQDTGVQVLNIGFPLLNLPPGRLGGATRRIMAPLALISVELAVKAGPTPVVQISCTGEGADMVMPNLGLLAWLEQQTGVSAEELFADEAGEEPWREIGDLVRHVAKVLKIEVPAIFAAEAVLPMADGAFELKAAPRAEDRKSVV